MEVLLLKDIAGVGKRGALKEVADGYALNYLLPRGLAQQATKEVVAAALKRVAEEERSTTAYKEKLRATLRSLDKQKITIRTRANEQGHLFKGVRADDVAEAIARARNVAIDPDLIGLGAQVIKDVGVYVVHITGEGIDAAVTLAVETAAN